MEEENAEILGETLGDILKYETFVFIAFVNARDEIDIVSGLSIFW